MAHLFGVATGWLGWTADTAWNTPIPELLAALDARIEWVQMTNPFGSKKKQGPPKDETPEERAARIKAAIRG